MLARILSLPFIVILMGIGACAMFLPAIYGFVVRDLQPSRVFMYGGTLFLILTSLVAIATANYTPRYVARSHLLALLGAFALLPVMLAIPFYEAVRDTTFLNAYIEMVSSLTTTGATLFEPERLSMTVHLWRGIVGWMGGFLVWVTAVAILAPMNLGGFEVTSSLSTAPKTPDTYSQIARVADPSRRLTRYATTLFPIYAGLTLVLWIALIFAGDQSVVAFIHAMSTLSTSGISPVGGMTGSAAGIPGEMIVFVFLFFALSRQTFATDFQSEAVGRLMDDMEFRMGLFCIGVVPTLLFLRHWVGAFDIDEAENLTAAFRALWGTVFTVASFLTTTGFASADWAEARAWSGLPTPGLILMGVALIGGGVGTTAGGVKLLRVYALYKHGTREIERLVHPSSVGGSGAYARRIRRQGAYIAWIFFMLFALSVALVMVALSLTGLDFETSMVMTVAALSTTGPLAQIAAEAPIAYSALGDVAKVILAAAMVLGRLETLAIIALLNPDFWRS